jgi:hypothetical protein
MADDNHLQLKGLPLYKPISALVVISSFTLHAVFHFTMLTLFLNLPTPTA